VAKQKLTLDVIAKEIPLVMSWHCPLGDKVKREVKTEKEARGLQWEQCHFGWGCRVKDLDWTIDEYSDRLLRPYAMKLWSGIVRKFGIENVPSVFTSAFLPWSNVAYCQVARYDDIVTRFMRVYYPDINTEYMRIDIAFTWEKEKE